MELILQYLQKHLLGIANSNPTYDMDVYGQLRVTSNAYLSIVNASNIVVASTGSLSVPSITGNGGVLNIGSDTSTSTVNIACGTISQIINLGTTGACNTTINIGGPGDIINFNGVTNTVTSTNTTSCNKTIDLNYGGAAGTGGSVGINVDEGGAVSGYIRTSADRNSWLFKAPNAPETKIDCTGGGITIGGLVMNTSSNVGIGTSPNYKLDVYGTLNATTYCNLQWSFITGVPTLAGFTNDLSNFNRTMYFNSNVLANAVAVSNLTVVSSTTLNNATITSLTGSNATLSNITGSLATTQITGTSFGTSMAIGCDTNTSAITIGTGSTTLLNIGNNNDGTVINIGGVGDVVNIPGTLLATLAETAPQSDGYYTYLDYGLGQSTADFKTTTIQLVSPSLSVGTGLSPLGSTSIVSSKFRVGLFTDPNKVFTLNKDNLAASGSNCGIEIEENGVIDGFFETTSDRSGWMMKAPAAGQVFVIEMGANFVSFNSNSFIMIGDSNGTIGMGTNNPNTAYKLHVAGPIYANQYVNLPISDVFGTVGTVSLCNAINSSSQTVAATSLAVQTAYNAAIGACNVATGRWIAANASANTQGISWLNDATNCNTLTASTSFAATPAAVAATYAYAATKWASNVANSTTQGLVYMTDSTSCNLSGDLAPIAASAKAVYLANQNANSRWVASFASNTAPGYSYISDATNCNRPWNTVDSFYQGPIAASVKAVYDTMQLAITASNKAFTPVSSSGTTLGQVYLVDSPTNSTNSNNTPYAATPYAVYQAYTLASTANTLAGTKWSNLKANASTLGTVYLMDAINSNTVNAGFGTPFAATPYAVSLVNTLATTASNRAYAAWLSNNASTSVPGLVFITDATTCNASTNNSVPVVPTAYALSLVQTLANTSSNQAYTHPSTIASSTNLGHVKLSDSYTDTTDDVTKGLAATPKAVGQLYNYFSTTTLTNVPTCSGTTTKGSVYLTDSTSCNVSQSSQPLAASAMAVYNAYQMAVAASNWASVRPQNIGVGSLTSQGALQLSDDTTSTSTSLAATIASVTRTWNYAYPSLQKAGGTMTGDLYGTRFLATSTVTACYNNQFFQLWGNSASLIANNTTDMRFGFASDINATNYAERMRLTAGGLLGIGNIPTAPLTITPVNNTTVADPSTNAIYVYNPTTNNALANSIVCMRVNGQTGGFPFVSWDVAGVIGWSAGIDVQDANKWKISNAWNSLTSATKMTITTGGYMGLNTTAPAYLLDVNGDAAVRGALRFPNAPAGAYISAGPGDGASDSTYDLQIGSWYGIGLYSTYTNSTNIVWDTRTGNASYNGTVNAGALTTSGDLNMNSGWIRSHGSYGWYCQDYGGGWNMSDTVWMRCFGDKWIWTGGNICCNSRMGAGTASPSYTLDVNGTSRLYDGLAGDCGFGGNYFALAHQTQFNTSSYALLQDSSGITCVNCAPGTNIRFRTGNGDWGLWNSTGLGVGTTSPGYPLDVVGQVNCSTGYHIAAYNGYLLDDNFDTSGGNRYGVHMASGVTRLFTAANYSPSAISLCQATGNGTFSDQLYITHAGNVGIGMNNPQYKLDVSGDIHTSGILRSDWWYSNTYGGGWYMSDTTWNRAYNDKWVWTGGNICCNGSMGVGTSSPGYKLDVQGTANFKFINDTWLVSGDTYQRLWFASAGTTWIKGYGGGSGNTHGFRNDSDTTTMTLTQNGTLYVYNDIWKLGHGTASYTGTSDKRIKKNIKDMDESAIDVLNKIKVRKYSWKNPVSHMCTEQNNTFVGFIAQELEEVKPEWVQTSDTSHMMSMDDLELLEDDKLKGVSLGHEFYGYLVKGIQELDASLKTANATIVAQQDVITKLITRLAQVEAKLNM